VTPREKELVERAVRLAREEWEKAIAIAEDPRAALAQVEEALDCLRGVRTRLRAELGFPDEPSP
jgi:hypothetical protein